MSPERAEAAVQNAPVSARENLKITRLETFLVKPRWLSLKVHTNAGIVCLGEPITEKGAPPPVQRPSKRSPYLVGKAPRLDENAMADGLGHDWRNQESYDADDGSVVDW